MLKSKASLLIILAVTMMMVGGTLYNPSAQADHVTDWLLEWEWEEQAYRLSAVVGDDGQVYTRVEIEGYLNAGGAPGWPSLPRLGKLVALPPDGGFELELVEVVYDTISLDYPVEPAPAPAPLQVDADGQPLPGGWTFVRDDTAYTGTTSHPTEFVALGEPAWMRNLRLARLTVTPFRYHPAHQTLDILRYLRLRIVPVGADEWEPLMASVPASSTGDTSSDVSPQVALDVLNPKDLDALRAPSPPIERKSPTTALQAPADYKVLVTTEGVHALDYQTLTSFGLPVNDINPATLRLIHAGGEIAAQWDGDGDTTFEDGERLLFYARPRLTRYAGYDVYWLAWGGGNGQRMASRSGDPTGLSPGTAWATVLAEENNEYDSLYPGWDGDHWFWRKLQLPHTLSETFTIPVETPAIGTTGELTAWLQGYTRSWPDPDHRVRFNLNGTNIGDASWEDKTPYIATFSLSAGLLSAGDNSLVLSLPGTGADVEGTWVDAITVTYGLSAVGNDVARFRGQSSASAYTIGGFSDGTLYVYDVTDAAAPLIMTNWTQAAGAVTVGDGGGVPAEYLILTDDQIQTPLAIVAAKPFSDPPGGADYIVITHSDFEASLAPLVDHRASQGLRVVVVDVEALYDRFGDGRMSPEAIRAFLSHAYTNWPGAPPLYVLLVGDGTYDPRGYRADSGPTYLPPYLDDVDPWLGETSSDHHYADLTGDRLPDLRLGRLPVNTPDEVAAVVNKIITYEVDPERKPWNRRLMFGADNPSTAADHHADCDSEYATYATPAYGYDGVRIYLSETGGDSHLYTDAQEAQNALIAAFNEGALLYTYFGHASWHQEAVLETDGYAPLFHLDHIPQLNNRRRWPVVLHMTCYTGYYIHQVDDTLDETLLRTSDVGAVAVWGPSGNGLAPGHNVLHRSFYQSVFDHEQAELGAATHAALGSLYAYGLYYDLIDTYHLFGDPAMTLNMDIVDMPFSIFLPVVVREA
jgi:hypothetical protein